MIMMENTDSGDTISDNHWVPSVHVNNTPGLAIKDYIATDANPTASIAGGLLGTNAFAPNMAPFSSRGPNGVAPDIIKPDITAPGVQILAGNSPFPDPGNLPDELFQAIAGTSMSSPHIAGTLALLKQAYPNWSPAMAKSAIMTTAYQDVLDSDLVSPADPFDMGAGHVNPGKPGDKGSMFQPGLVYDAGFNDYLAFLCSADNSVFGNPAATCAALEGAGYSLDESDLNLPSIGVAALPGSQTVRRTVTNGMGLTSAILMPVVIGGNGQAGVDQTPYYTYTVSVDAPDGYDVVVAPDELVVWPGTQATYQVTITNQTAPLNEWRFGSLTWTDGSGMTEVYSPIAVQGVQIGVPSQVEGAGEEGETSFDVDFGYTGDYTAAAARPGRGHGDGRQRRPGSRSDVRSRRRILRILHLQPEQRGFLPPDHGTGRRG